MKKWRGLFEEPTSRSHRHRVLQTARVELEDRNENLFGWKQSLQWMATAAGVAGLAWIGARNVRPPQDEAGDQAALFDTDLELLENLELLEDLDILTNDELDEWT